MTAPTYTRDARPSPSSSPIAIRIGVTGHRTGVGSEKVRTRLNHVMRLMDSMHSGVKHRYVVLSPLAEGADRMVAQFLCEWADTAELSPAQLEVVLPFAEEQYIETFNQGNRKESIQEFESLRRLAEKVKVLEGSATRHDAYERVGRYVVEHCDALIAIWDGEKARGRGGTANVIAHAKQVGVPVIWINSLTGYVHWIPGKKGYLGPLFEQAQLLETFLAKNGEVPPAAQSVDYRYAELARHAVSAGLGVPILAPLKDFILPHMVKAAGFAQKYQKCYYRSVKFAYYLSAAAVGISALATIDKGPGWLYLLEILAILTAVYLVWPSRFRTVQRNWIDHRYLAERLRASCFLYVAGLREETSDPPPDLRLSWLPMHWVALLLRYVWQGLPPSYAHIEMASEEGVDKSRSRFLRSAWIDHQQKYYEGIARWNEDQNQKMEGNLKICVIVTLTAAVLHFALPQMWPGVEDTLFPSIFSFVAVTVPAIACAIAGVGVFHHYSRNAERSERMSEHLQEVSALMTSAESARTNTAPVALQLSPLQSMIQEVDRSMQHEQQGWRVVFGVKLPGPG